MSDEAARARARPNKSVTFNTVTRVATCKRVCLDSAHIQLRVRVGARMAFQVKSLRAPVLRFARVSDELAIKINGLKLRSLAHARVRTCAKLTQLKLSYASSSSSSQSLMRCARARTCTPRAAGSGRARASRVNIKTDARAQCRNVRA